MTKHELL